jgi:hypothetical protein
MENKKLTIRHLREAFAHAGMPVSQSWIRRQEDKGNLLLPRSTTNFKMAQGARRSGAVRQMTRTIIIEVLKAFLPQGQKLPNGEVATGSGYYNYLKDKSNHEAQPTQSVS